MNCLYYFFILVLILSSCNSDKEQSAITEQGRLVDIGDTELYIVERGAGYRLIVLHGGPGLDHHSFGNYLDDLADDFRLIYVDQRAQGHSAKAPEETWTIAQNAKDVGLLAAAIGLQKYAVLGHS